MGDKEYYMRYMHNIITKDYYDRIPVQIYFNDKNSWDIGLDIRSEYVHPASKKFIKNFKKYLSVPNSFYGIDVKRVDVRITSSLRQILFQEFEHIVTKYIVDKI